MRSQSSHHYYSQNDPDSQPQMQYRLSVGGMVNQVLLLVFGACLLLFLLSFFAAPFRWIFIIVTAVALAFMWWRSAFLPRGRLVLSGVFAVFFLISLATFFASNAGSTPPLANFATSLPIYNNYGAAGSETTTPPTTMVPQGGDTTGALTGSSGQIDPVTGLLVVGSTPADQGQTVGTSKAEEALNQFMICWQTGIVDNMVPLTSTSWRNKMSTNKSGPAQNLYWKFSPKKLLSWHFEGTPTGTDQDESRTITVVAEVSTSNSQRSYRYDAIMIREGESWFVDPESLAGGTRVEEEAAPTETVGELLNGETLVITPTPAPAATPEPDNNTKLYYNAKGGKYYHSKEDCSSVSVDYLPLTSFSYGKLGEKPYKALKPCTKCNPPTRP